MGIYFVIAGHMFSLWSDYIYTFSVPLFFAISGFLCHYESDGKVFWMKLFQNLIIPGLLVCLIVLCGEVLLRAFFHKTVWSMVPHRIINIIIGNQGKGVKGGGLGMCWFIYTLVICRIIYQYLSKYKYINFATILLFLVLSFFYNKKGQYVYNSVLDVTLAYPVFFYGGEIIRMLSKAQFKRRRTLVLMLLASLLTIGIITYFNGSVRMYGGIYGNNLILFLIGAAAGCIAFFSLSVLIQHYRPRMLSILSIGTILILGFHNYFLIGYKFIFKECRSAVTDYLFSLIVLLAFIPIISFTKRFFPILLGQRSKT